MDFLWQDTPPALILDGLSGDMDIKIDMTFPSEPHLGSTSLGAAMTPTDTGLCGASPRPLEFPLAGPLVSSCCDSKVKSDTRARTSSLPKDIPIPTLRPCRSRGRSAADETPLVLSRKVSFSSIANLSGTEVSCSSPEITYTSFNTNIGGSGASSHNTSASTSYNASLYTSASASASWTPATQSNAATPAITPSVSFSYNPSCATSFTYSAANSARTSQCNTTTNSPRYNGGGSLEGSIGSRVFHLESSRSAPSQRRKPRKKKLPKWIAQAHPGRVTLRFSTTLLDAQGDDRSHKFQSTSVREEYTQYLVSLQPEIEEKRRTAKQRRIQGQATKADFESWAMALKQRIRKHCCKLKAVEEHGRCKVRKAKAQSSPGGTRRRNKRGHPGSRRETEQAARIVQVERENAALRQQMGALKLQMEEVTRAMLGPTGGAGATGVAAARALAGMLGLGQLGVRGHSTGGGAASDKW